MGGWKLEVGKMAMYITFPVVLFYVFNQPQYFENWVVEMRRELYPPENKTHRKEIEAFIRGYHARKEKEMMESLEMENPKE